MTAPSFNNLNLAGLNRELLVAAGNNRVRSVESLLKRGASLDYKDDTSLTALHHATLSGCKYSVRVLLDKGADVDAHSPIYGTALCLAIIKDRTNIADILLEHRPSVKPRTDVLGTALHCASWTGDCKIASTLVSRGAEVNHAADIVPFHYKELRESGVTQSTDAQHTTLPSHSPLCLAVWSGHLEMTKLLLEEGAVFEKGRRTVDIPFIIACQRNQVPIVELLIGYGVNVTRRQYGGLPLIAALDRIESHADTRLLKTLLRTDSLIAEDDIYYMSKSFEAFEYSSHAEMIAPMLLIAAAAETANALKLLQKLCADLEARFSTRSTVLHLFAWENQLVGAKRLLKRGINVDIRDGDSLTPMMFAVRGKHL